MLTTIETLVRRFFAELSQPEDILYNEASLQHELALFLRQHLVDGWRVYIERPAWWFRREATGLVKKEIDLIVADHTQENVIAIELKCPRRGQHPEQMFKACQDLEFLEQLVASGFSGGVFAMHVHDPLFYHRGSQRGIYAHFRAGAPICGIVRKPTGARDKTVSLRRSYIPIWMEDVAGGRYWVQPVPPSAEESTAEDAARGFIDAGAPFGSAETEGSE